MHRVKVGFLKLGELQSQEHQHNKKAESISCDSSKRAGSSRHILIFVHLSQPVGIAWQTDMAEIANWRAEHSRATMAFKWALKRLSTESLKKETSSSKGTVRVFLRTEMAESTIKNRLFKTHGINISKKLVRRINLLRA